MLFINCELPSVNWENDLTKIYILCQKLSIGNRYERKFHIKKLSMPCSEKETVFI